MTLAIGKEASGHKWSGLYPNKTPVEDVDDQKRGRESYSTTTVDPLGDFLRRHGWIGR